jgi:glucan biosynthesis protein C
LTLSPDVERAGVRSGVDHAGDGLGGNMDLAGTTVIQIRRRPDLDLIRVAVVASLTFYHSALIFGPVDFYINYRPPSSAMTAFVFFAALFGMPLLFIVAGESIWHSLGTRTTGNFVRERISRLLVPLLVGIAVVVPPQLYFSARADGQDPGSYWRFLGRFFDVRLSFDFPSIVQPARPAGLFDVAHLWFLYYLLVYSLLLLPLFLYLRGEAGPRLTGWLLSQCRKPWGLLLFALPVAVLEAALGTFGPGGWNSYTYPLFLVYGFLLAANRRLAEALQGHVRQAVVVGVLVLVALFVIAHNDLGGADQSLGADYGPWSVAWRLLRAIAGWVWTVAMIGLATFLVGWTAKLLPRAANDLRANDPDGQQAHLLRAARRYDAIGHYVKEAVLPFYVLHQTPIVVIGFYAVQWRVGVLPKYLTISLAALALTLVTYDLCVRRAGITRVLFGLRHQRDSQSTRRSQISRQYE